ncbi:PrpF protein [Filobasidium floriforme]|uniref:PrpF protein n=1 Tax=Filobasidium floriforme TaxID=5210 RepID=UPI001E8DE713|nr:PrpF protein [Filobasidium floriforme]KAH8083220.1 PrpF protein [Filobasidium floriforme]
MSASAAFYRGGTSKGVIFEDSDLPTSNRDREHLFSSCIGSPDPYGRQLDGMGGGISSLSKVCIVKRSEQHEADVEFTFVQVGVKDGILDTGSNCGNMVSAIGPFALEKGMPSTIDEHGRATVRIFNTNTNKMIHSHFPTIDGLADVDGDFEMDGVPGTSAQIQLDFINPGGSRTGKLLPTGNVVDELQIPGAGSIPVTLVDCANPGVFIAAETLGLDGSILPDELQSKPKTLEILTAIRRAAGIRMGVFADENEARKIRSVPKVCIISPTRRHTLLSGQTIEAQAADVIVRTISSEDPHRAIPITAAICVAAAANMSGSVFSSVFPGGKPPAGQAIRIAHPSGTIAVDADLNIDEDGSMIARSGTIYRTARKLFDGKVYYRSQTAS